MKDSIHSRTERLIGTEGIYKLSQARVAVIGLGGVGSACAEALARSGIGSFLFIDKDIVEPSNINRQQIAFLSTIGQRKVDVMTTIAHDINPACIIDTAYEFVKEKNINEILGAFDAPDYVVDAVDTLTAKAAIAAWASSHDIPVISSMGMANRSDPTKLAFASLFETAGCPFCREMRKICRDRNINHLEVLYSTERPTKVLPEVGADRSEKTELGTHSYMPPIAGMMLASWIIKSVLTR